MHTLSLIVCFVIIHFTYAQSKCDTKKINKYFQCVKTTEDSMKTKLDQLKKQGHACFTSNNCQIPKKPFKAGFRNPHGDISSSGSGSGSSESVSQTAEVKNKTRQCEKAVHDEFEKRLDQCVQSETDLIVPHMADGHKKPHRGSQPFGIGMPMDQGPFRGQMAHGPPGSFGQGGHGPQAGFGPLVQNGPGRNAGHRGPDVGGQGARHARHTKGHNFVPQPGTGFQFQAPPPGSDCPIATLHMDAQYFAHVRPRDPQFMENKQKTFIRKSCNNTENVDSATNEVYACLQEFRNSTHEQMPKIMEELAVGVNACRQILELDGCNSTDVHDAMQIAGCARQNCTRKIHREINETGLDLSAGIEACRGVTLEDKKPSPKRGRGHPKGGFGNLKCPVGNVGKGKKARDAGHGQRPQVDNGLDTAHGPAAGSSMGGGGRFSSGSGKGPQMAGGIAGHPAGHGHKNGKPQNGGVSNSAGSGETNLLSPDTDFPEQPPVPYNDFDHCAAVSNLALTNGQVDFPMPMKGPGKQRPMKNHQAGPAGDQPSGPGRQKKNH